MTWLSTAPWFVQSPWMLLALLSMVVPLAIHLFSKSKGKVIPFGNIKLIQVSKLVRMNEIRLVKRLLLLCRLLILLFSVLLLTQFYYDDRAHNTVNPEGNILVTKDWLNNAKSSELNTLELKAKTGVVYLLSRKNKRLTSEIISTWQKDQSKVLTENIQQNTWLLAKNYANSLPSETKITVYSTNRLSQFIGDKVALPDNIAWLIKRLPIDKLTDSINELKVTAISMLIITDKDSSKDIEYLHTALSLIKDNKLKNLSFEFQHYDFQDDDFKNNNFSSNQQHNIPKNDQFKMTECFDWIFYLSSASIPDYVLEEVQKGTKLILDVKHSQNNKATNIIHWNELVSQLQLPQILMSLLLDKSIQHYQEQQQLTNKQIESQLVTKASLIPLLVIDQFKNLFIDKFLILFLVIFWAIERLLSEGKIVKQRIVSENSSSSELFKNTEKADDA